MMSETLKPEDVEAWRGWIGRTEERAEVLDAEALRRFAAAVGSDLQVETTPPPLAHWAFFLPVVGPEEIGADGHPKRGGFLPPVTLPRRMFASSDMGFGPALTLGAPATLVSTIASVTHKSGKSGDLVFVEVDRAIRQGGETCVAERQTIVYRDDGGRTAPVETRLQAIGAGDEVWTPGPVDLFRFSAVTFNSHRIHYDAPYASEVEGYPGLVVHGPFTAARLFAYAQRRSGAPLKTFAFRAMAPMFCGQPIRLTVGETAGEVVAVRADGSTGMSAKFEV